MILILIIVITLLLLVALWLWLEPSPSPLNVILAVFCSYLVSIVGLIVLSFIHLFTERKSNVDSR